MTQSQIVLPPEEMVAVYLDESPDNGWFGYSHWFKRHILRREFSIYTTPQFISREDLKVLKIAIAYFGYGRLKVYQLTTSKITN